MYASQLKLLLKNLIYICDDSNTYLSLSLVNKYCEELTKYYSPMKMREFCKEIKWKLVYVVSGETGTAYVLPNGRVLKSIVIKGEDTQLDYPLDYFHCTNIFDIKNYMSIYISESNLRGYYVDNIRKHYEYFYNGKLYSSEDKHFTIKFVIGPKAGKCEFSSRRCCHCKKFHDFTVIIDTYKFFSIFRHCGLKTVKYLYYNVGDHLKRRKVIHAVIQYARNIRSLS